MGRNAIRGLLLFCLVHYSLLSAQASASDQEWWEDKYISVKVFGEGYRYTAYEAIRKSDTVKCIVKVYRKGTSKMEEAFKREVEAMKLLRGCPGVPQLLEAVESKKDDEKKLLVFEFMKDDDIDDLAEEINDLDIRLYMRQLLEALSCAHARGLIHLDLSPGRVVVDAGKKELKLIDWNRARVFQRGARLLEVSPGVTSFAPPELLLGMGADSAADIWAVGQLMGGLIYHRHAEALIHVRRSRLAVGAEGGEGGGKDKGAPEGQSDGGEGGGRLPRHKRYYEQLRAIGKIMGTEKIYEYMRHSYINLSILNPELKELIGSHDGKGIDYFEDGDNKNTASKEGEDLLSKMLHPDPRVRITAEQALKHAYFDPVRQRSR